MFPAHQFGPVVIPFETFDEIAQSGFEVGFVLLEVHPVHSGCGSTLELVKAFAQVRLVEQLVEVAEPGLPVLLRTIRYSPQ